MDYKEITDLIKNSERKTPCIFYISSKNSIVFKKSDNYNVYGDHPFYIVIGDFDSIKSEIDYNKHGINYYDYNVEARNSALPLLKKEYSDSRMSLVL